MPDKEVRDGIVRLNSPQGATAATWMAGAWDEYAYRLSCAMAAVGPPPGVVGAQDVLQALQGAEHMQRNTSDTARQRFAHARRVLETIKHGLDDTLTALALAEGQLTATTSPSSSSALVAVYPGPWVPTYVSTVGRPLSTGDQDQQLVDVPADALIASRPASRHGCARHHTSHSSQDAPYNESAPRGFIEHQGQLQTIKDAQDHVALDECSLVRPAHIRKDGTNHHAHHSPGPPSPSRITASDYDRRHLSASQDGRSYDAEGQAHDEHVTARNNAQMQHSTGTSACGAYGTGARCPLNLDQEAARLREQDELRLRRQQELRQQVWEAKKRALEAEAARVREARAATGPISNSEGQPSSSGAEEEAGLPPSLSRRSTSSARRHSSPAPPRRLVDRIEAPRLVDRIEPHRASLPLIDRIEPPPLVDPASQSSPPTSHPIPLIDRIERIPYASSWRSPTPSLDESFSPSVDDFEEPAADDIEDATADVHNGNSTPLFLSPTPHASSSDVAWRDADVFIRKAIHKSPSSDDNRTLNDAQRTLNDAQRTLYNADQAGWTPSSLAASVTSDITRRVEEMVVDDEEDAVVMDGGEGAGTDEVRAGFDDGARTGFDDGKGPGSDEDYEGEMPMEFSEDEGGADDDASPSSADTSSTSAGCPGSPTESCTSPPNSPSADPPATPTEFGSPLPAQPGSPTLTKLAFFENVPLDEPSPLSSPALSLVEEQSGSPYASRVQGLLESTSRPALETTAKRQDGNGSQGQGGEMELRLPSPAPSFSLEGRGGVHAHTVCIPLPPPLRFGTPYYSTDANVETPATLRYPELPEPSAYAPSHSLYAYAPSQSTYPPPPQSAHIPTPSAPAPSSSTVSTDPAPTSRIPEPSARPRARKAKAPTHSRLYKKARKSLANSMCSATARDIKTVAHRAPAMIAAVRPPAMNSCVRLSATDSSVRSSATNYSVCPYATTSTVPPPAANPTVGARFIAASAPPPGQVVTFAQLGAGYRLTSAVLDSGEGASESGGEEDPSDSDLDSLFDEIPEDSVDAGSGHPSDIHAPVEMDGKEADAIEKGEGGSEGVIAADSDTEYTMEEEVVAVRTRLGEGEITIRRRVRQASGNYTAARPSKRIKLTY